MHIHRAPELSRSVLLLVVIFPCAVFVRSPEQPPNDAGLVGLVMGKNGSRCETVVFTVMLT